MRKKKPQKEIIKGKKDKIQETKRGKTKRGKQIGENK